MAAVAEYCPTCGSAIDAEGECPSCLVDRPPTEITGGPGSDRSCRRCGAAVPKRAAVCPVCGVDHPSSMTGIAPVGLFVLALFAIAAILGILSFLAGPVVS